MALTGACTASPASSDLSQKRFGALASTDGHPASNRAIIVVATCSASGSAAGGGRLGG
eukprot:CAMPEP_0183419812 /NCGR_PEP_ID=MMETSP0370-20130417/26030_1 /TAXON_ID=268820 /ORGANISM="Peridinium aciculiferum, Strain PAER-2" /LENGTH=57 /DNA_ID=CAMNT_0025603647 /DNA_START=55 /DNA_END=225 /DNA_ORIENTATION=+